MQDVFSHISQNDIYESIITMERHFLKLNNLQNFSIGFEYEFYCLSVPNQEFFKELASVDVIKEVKEEIGCWQFELVTIPQNSFIEACHAMQWVKSSLIAIAKKHKISISQNASTFQNTLPPSSMQVSISMRDKSDNFLNASSQVFMRCIYNLLHNLHSATLLLCPTQNCYLRLSSQKIAKQFKNCPTHINWGVENRTLAIRIANIYEDTQGKRIEYRVPSPVANPYHVGLAILSSLLCASKIEYPQIFIDSWESNSKKLPQNLDEAYKYFVNSQIFSLINTFTLKNAI